MTEYSLELKEQIVKEIAEVGSVVAVCRKHNLNPKTVHNWVYAARNKHASNELKTVRELTKKLYEKEIENKVLKELLKKTVQVWNNEDRL